MNDKTSRKKRTDPSWEKIPNPTPGRPHPFSEEELNKFHLRGPMQDKSFMKSIERTVEAHETPRHKRKLV